MCGVCGLLGGGPHWSAAAGALESENAPTLRAERARVATLLNRLTSQVGVRVSTWSGTSYVLSGPTGAQEVVETLSDVWPAVDRLSRRRLDPLNPAWSGTPSNSGATRAQ